MMAKKIPALSYFPLLIQYDGCGYNRAKVHAPEEIESGKSFHVIETNYNRDDLKYTQVREPQRRVIIVQFQCA